MKSCLQGAHDESHKYASVLARGICLFIDHPLQTHLCAQKDLVLGEDFKLWELKRQAGSDIYHILVNNAHLCCILTSNLQQVVGGTSCMLMKDMTVAGV